MYFLLWWFWVPTILSENARCAIQWMRQYESPGLDLLTSSLVGVKPEKEKENS